MISKFLVQVTVVAGPPVEIQVRVRFEEIISTANDKALMLPLKRKKYSA